MVDSIISAETRSASEGIDLISFVIQERARDLRSLRSRSDFFSFFFLFFKNLFSGRCCFRDFSGINFPGGCVAHPRPGNAPFVTEVVRV